MIALSTFAPGRQLICTILSATIMARIMALVVSMMAGCILESGSVNDDNDAYTVSTDREFLNWEVRRP